MTEAEIQLKIQNYLKYLGAWVVKPITTNLKGTPDILACLDGRFIGIEVKKLGGKPRASQERQIRLILKAGGISFVARSVDDVKASLNQHNLL